MRGLVRYNNLNQHPFRLLDEFEKDMKSIFRSSFFDMDGEELGMSRGFFPACYLEDRESHLLLNVDLPGVPKEDIKIEIKDNQLNIIGERKIETNSKNYSERSYGSFKRSMRLPEGTDVEKIEANYENGVLSIAIPKTEKAKPKTIEITSNKKDGLFSKLLGNKKEETKTIEVES